MVLWDIWDPHVFVLAEKNQTFVYVYSPVNIWSPCVSFLGAFKRPFSAHPVGLQNGTLTCQLENGVFENLTLPTHRLGHGNTHAKERFKQNLDLLHLKEAWTDAKILNTPEVWDILTKKAMEQMKIEIAIKACQDSCNATLLMDLTQLQQVEEHFLLAGHILLLLQFYDAAQALELAEQLNLPMTEITREYAQQLEMRGDHRLALSHYEKYLKSDVSKQTNRYLAEAGFARMCIQLGDLWKGRQMAIQCNNTQLYLDCAQILEGLNLLQDAGEMYELGGQIEKAAGLYITVKSYTKAHPLLDRIASPKLQIEDIDNAVRLQLGSLGNPARAFSILRKTRSMEGAAMAAKYCKLTGDFDNAIEFLIMQKRTQEASELAQQHNKMDIYTEIVKDVATKDECLKLARYYESMESYEKACALFEKCGEPKQALHLYLHWGTATGIELAIELVGRLRCDALTSQLLDYLTGEMDQGVEKGPKYLFQLHTVLGNYEQATKAALLIAHQEQEMGNYKMAHQQLLGFCKVLQAQKRCVPLELSKQLMLLHSYILVKTLIRLGDHRSSARMLIRVARHISKFPAHVTPILISTVIECQRSGLKRTAFEYASMLMRPEYRSAISVAYKRKIENIVRKPEKTEEEESLAPCPTCSLEIPETQLDCPACCCTIPVKKTNLFNQPSLSLFHFTFLPLLDVQLILLPIDVNFQVQRCKLF
ncbi:hypothetical protein BDL97_06G126400 [Sphagnum fallax]|nr:hypothetical protein BDL97_06G126400 [Sphagnum fallax]